MSSDIPCLSLTVSPLKTLGQFAVHVTDAPYPGGYVLNDCLWTEPLTQLWQAWQNMFSVRKLPNVPQISQVNGPLPDPILQLDASNTSSQPIGLTGRLMQTLGISLWQWLFDGPIQGSLNHSQGIAMGQNKPLRLRLEIRDPDMIALPWEIMQDGAGKQAISLSQQILFSRTTRDVHTLPLLRSDDSLKILLVLGQDAEPGKTRPPSTGEASRQDALRALKLKQEAAALEHVLENAGNPSRSGGSLCQVDTLVQPTPADLIQHLETKTYNVLFYAGHGVPAPDGGLLFLRPDMTLNGTELAQILTRCQVKLAVFNACWGAQPDHYEAGSTAATISDLKPSQAIPRSSLAEVLIHHGVPAVLGMRDSITDEEALSFIQAFAKALAERMAIDRAVAIGRQHLLTLYKFNQHAWTLPVLYMHPEFNGELLQPPLENDQTRLPPPTLPGHRLPTASLRSLRSAKIWQIQGSIRIGRDKVGNDVVLQEDQGGVSRNHAIIFCRQFQRNGSTETTYFLKDMSTYGSWVRGQEGWQKVHQEEVPIQSGSQFKFGSSQNEPMEFMVHKTSE